MKTHTKLCFAIIVLLIYSCSSSSIKENINKTGDAAGQAIGELASGISNGVEKSVEPKIEANTLLKDKGITFGKMTIISDSLGHDNILVAYVIFDKDFAGFLIAKAFDSKGLEMGRVKQEIKGVKDETKFVEFHFDRRTEIDNGSKITLE